MAEEVRVTAPVRVLDAGGWTDTWFARSGAVCNLAVGPGVQVTVRRSGMDRRGGPSIDLSVLSFGDRYRFAPDALPGRHPLLERALLRWAPPGASLDVAVSSSVPPGSGLGTSAAVVVALVAALTSLSGPGLGPDELARAAHRIETEDVGLESGVQDQLASAHGGAVLLTVERYPQTTARVLDVSDETWSALARRIVTVYLGRPHRSSEVHQAVIARVGEGDPAGALDPLRAAARSAASALVAGDLGAYGRAMIDNTEGQASLHPGLVGRRAREVIALARSHRSAGWKVNGAGGDGGSVTIVGPEDPAALASGLGSLPGVDVLALEPTRSGAVVSGAG